MKLNIIRDKIQQIKTGIIIIYLKFRFKFRNDLKYFKNVKIGENFSYPHNTIIHASQNSFIKIGKNFELYPYTKLSTFDGFIDIGDDCSCHEFCILYGHGGLKIGNNVRIAAHTVIIPANHIFNDLNKPIRLQGETRNGITIEEDVWIGSRVTILDGVTIGKGSVIGAGSVVTRSIPPNSVAFGIPAKVVKKRNQSGIQGI